MEPTVHKPAINNPVITIGNHKGRAMTKRKDAVKRALITHLSGWSGQQGLAIKALEALSRLVESSDPTIALAAVDKVVKLLPYAISREDLSVPGSNNTLGQPINVQINFDQQMRDRLQGTHLQGLMDNFIVVNNPSPQEPQP